MPDTSFDDFSDNAYGNSASISSCLFIEAIPFLLQCRNDLRCSPVRSTFHHLQEFNSSATLPSVS